MLDKCKIAPIKQLSLPRLELQAALYSVRLRKLSVEWHDLLIDSIVSVTHWTDSLTVFQWLHSADRKQNAFVGNIAAENLEASTIDEWKHIKGELNPSDIGTCGITIEKLSESDWLFGPTWFKSQSKNWPISRIPVILVIEGHTQVAGIANNSMVGDHWNQFNSFSICVRVVAYCLRLNYKSQSKVLANDELQRAEERAIKLIQIETFSDFCNGKQDVKKTNKGGSLAKLSPFSDEKWLIRIRGRIKHANLSFEQRHPILISRKHAMVNLMFTRFTPRTQPWRSWTRQKCYSTEILYIGFTKCFEMYQESVCILMQITCADESSFYSWFTNREAWLSVISTHQRGRGLFWSIWSQATEKNYETLVLFNYLSYYQSNTHWGS